MVKRKLSGKKEERQPYEMVVYVLVCWNMARDQNHHSLTTGFPRIEQIRVIAQRQSRRQFHATISRGSTSAPGGCCGMLSLADSCF